MEKANLVREYVAREYIAPARNRKQLTVKVRAGEVQKAVGLKDRIALVCQALKGKKFLQENRLILEKLEGPKSGTSTTVVFTYRLADPDVASDRGKTPSFVTLRGIAKDLFRSLGGGESFIQKERESFHDDQRNQ